MGWEDVCWAGERCRRAVFWIARTTDWGASCSVASSLLSFRWLETRQALLGCQLGATHQPAKRPATVAQLARLIRVHSRAALPYKWRQTLTDLTITLPVPPGTRGKQLDVQIKKKHVRVGLKGLEPVLEGELFREVKVDESTWTLGALASL